MVLYYQHYTGTIRYKQLRENDWVGGTLSEVVAFDAKNGTPISAVAYALNNVSTVSSVPDSLVPSANVGEVAHLLHRHREPRPTEVE
jgi:hypothetical protein